MINTPANDMGPLQIETIAREIAELHGATIAVVAGDDLLAENYPAVHAVGRAADPSRSPRMIEISWGAPEQPLVCLVGKGVVFDTGGLDIKPSAGMRQMKKDMGGAAHALALGRMIMAANLPVRLVVLTPVVENAISGDAMRPGDVLASRKGLSIEVGNTDAEGRLILADALTYCVRELGADRLVDIATLTGGVVVALGSTYAGLISNDDDWAERVRSAAQHTGELAWRLPLHPEYKDLTRGSDADLTNASAKRKASAIYAGSFLEEFVDAKPWAHLDIAGTAWDVGRAYVGNGPTGYGVRLFVALAAELADS
jgi:leucyl aminopeptidase